MGILQQVWSGGVTLLVIFGLSLFAGTVAAERLANFRRRHVLPDGLVDRVRPLWRAGDDDALESVLRYLDRWHIIGQFPNEHRRNIEKRFPPEFGVDLDAEYLGKDDRLLHWKYFEADSYPLVPPGGEQYAVYYGYTEVMMDRERDLWVSFGSDDESKVWLNDALVWRSGTGFKPWYNGGGYRSLPTYVRDWNLTESRRRLHFRKGRNRLLFRLENGYGLQFFSMVIEVGAKGHSRSGP